jgi:flavin-dependent dehydrogenase
MRPAALSRSSPRGRIRSAPDPSPMCCQAEVSTTITVRKPAQTAAFTMPGLVSVGDAVCTTTPNFGRGITTSLLQAQEPLRLVDEHGDDVEAVGYAFDEWCATAMRPWVEDHVAMNDDMPL